MKCSIIIPAYNTARTLDATINSIMKCGLSDYEIILIDDGSKDDTPSLCDRFAAEYPAIRSYHQPNSGVSAARNHGLALAQGEYVWFFDADDSVAPGSMSDLEHILLVQQPDVLMFGMSFDYYWIGENYRSEQITYPQPGQKDRAMWKTEIQALFQCNYLSPVWNKLIRRKLLTENQLGFNTDMFLLEDLEFSFRCLSLCDIVYLSDRAIYRYRQPEDEGNAGRRLKRFDKLSYLLGQLETALNTLSVSLDMARGQFDDLLADIFLMLARQKIQVSRRKEIGVICDDFIAWLAKHRVSPEQLSGTYTNKVLQRKAGWLFWRSRYSAVRHTVANRVKYLRYLKKRRSAHG